MKNARKPKPVYAWAIWARFAWKEDWLREHGAVVLWKSRRGARNYRPTSGEVVRFRVVPVPKGGRRA